MAAELKNQINSIKLIFPFNFNYLLMGQKITTKIAKLPVTQEVAGSSPVSRAILSDEFFVGLS